MQSTIPVLASQGLAPSVMLPDRAVRKLAGAILIQALRDLEGRNDPWRADALRWLRSDLFEPTSFCRICFILGLNPDLLRRRLEENRRDVEASKKNWEGSQRG